MRYLIVVGVLLAVVSCGSQEPEPALGVIDPDIVKTFLSIGYTMPICTRGYGPVKVVLDPAMELKYGFVTVDCGKIVEPDQS